MLRIETHQVEPDILVLVLSGVMSWESDSQKRVMTVVQQLLDQGNTKLVFDLSGVNPADDTLISVIAWCFGAVRRSGGGIRIGGTNPKVTHLLKITHADMVLAPYASVSAAAESLTLAREQGP